MELRHLRYFVAVAEELNFRKAADRLRVAQPALSSQIQDLEADLGVKLLERNTGGVRMTAAGVAFLAETRLTLAQAERAAVIAREAADGRRGRLAIGYLGSLTMAFMPSAMKTFRLRYPDVEVTMVDMPALSEQITAIDRGELQMAFSVRPDSAIPDHFDRRLVLRSVGRVGVGRGHRLARAKSVSLEELAGENLVCLGNRRGESAHREIIARAFASAGVKLGPIRLVDGPEALHALLASGLGVSLLAESVGLAQRKEIVLLKIKGAKVETFLEVRAIWPKGPSALLARNFVDTFRPHTSAKE